MKYFLNIVALLCVAFSFGQAKTDSIVSTQDSIIDAKQIIKAEIKPELDSLSVRKLEDNELAAELDRKWLEELYSNTLYDTIYKTVTELRGRLLCQPGSLATISQKSKISAPKRQFTQTNT